MPGGPQQMGRAQRLQLAFDAADQLRRHYGNAVLAIGVHGSVAQGSDLPYSDINLHCILDGSNHASSLAWSTGPWKAQVNVWSEDVALQRASVVGADWSYTHSAFTHVLAVFDPRNFFSRLRVAALSQPDTAFQAAILDVIVGEIYSRVGNIRNAVVGASVEELDVLVTELAKSGTCLVGLANRHLYAESTAVVRESLSLPDRPAGYRKLCELVLAEQRSDPGVVARASDGFWQGVEQWAVERAIEIEQQLSALLAKAARPARRESRLDRAITFVQTNGTQLERVRLRCAIGDQVNLAEAEAAVAAHQLPEGSFTLQVIEGSDAVRGSLGETLECLRWLRELGLHGRSQMVRTLDFLAMAQDADGSFFASHQGFARSALDWLGRDNLTDRFFFTAAFPMRLYSIGYSEHPMIRPALRWLRAHWSDWQLVTSTRQNLWALLCISRAPIGLSGSLYEKCYATALDWLPQIPARQLAWFLDGLEGAGFELNEPLVSKALDRLATLQRADGIWHDPPGSVDTTITALRLFRNYRAPLPRELF